MLESVQEDLPDLERLHAAAEGRARGQGRRGGRDLTALVNDPSTGERRGREAERMLKRAKRRAVDP
jgi:hypothetical protein